jgi:predicted outer membrane repeat protein
MHPLIGSLAIDNAGPDPGGTDARGFPRFVDGDAASAGAQLDIGAVEAGPLRTVDSVGGLSLTGLRATINASTEPGARIAFSQSVFPATSIEDIFGEFTITAGRTFFIDASNLTGPVTLSGRNLNRVFNIPATATVAMHSVRIVNGLAPSGGSITLLDSSGGGILNKGTCSVFFSTISGNSANAIGAGLGNLGTCIVFSSTLSGNTSPFGGGGIYNNGNCTVISSTIAGHSVTIGGGIYNERICRVISSTISGNSAATFGGGIFTNNSNGTFHLSTSIVAGNNAPNDANISNTLASNINNLTSGDPLLSPLGDYGGPTQTMPPRPGSPAIDAAGPVSEVQQVAIGALPAVFTLTFNGATTGSLNQFLTASEVATALQNLGTIGSGNVTVEKTNNEVNDTFFRITFIGARGGSNHPQLISNNSAAQVTTVLNGSPGSPLATDQRGLRRPRDGDGNGSALPDLGAVESSLALVTTLANTGTGSLRAAVEEVAAQPGADLIVFHPDLGGGTITLGSQIITTDPAGITIDATALSGGLTLSGGNTSRHFTVQPGGFLTLRGLSLTGGNNGAGTFGGSIFNAGTLHLFRCVLTRNTSVGGGAITSIGTLECQDSTFSENTATGFGGALYLTSPTSNAILTRCTFSDNTAADGGAILHEGTGPASFSSCTIAGNRSTAEGSGAGLSVRDGVATLAHCTVSQNVGNNGSGGLLLQAPATVNLVFSIIAGNGDLVGSQPDISTLSGTLNSFGVNLIGDNSSVEMQFPAGSPNAQGNYVGNSAAPLNARLSPLASFGGPVQTMHPLIGSPAIDTAGDIVPSGLDVDARGFPRFVDGDASGFEQLDIGAVEAGPLLTVTSNAADGDNSLRTRISQGALTLIGARIAFSPSVFPAQTILLDGDTEIFIPATSALFIDASNLAAPVTISGNNASRVFNIIQGATVAMHSLRIVDGLAAPGPDGGGIFNLGTCTVMSCTLSGNRADTGGGGAIGNIGTLALMQSTLSGNVGLLGGAVYSGGPMVATQCTMAGNSGSLRGGAIENFGPMVLRQCTLAGNSAASGAGGILNFNQLTLHNSIVAGNNSPGAQDVLMGGGTISAIGVNFIGNTVDSTLTASPTLLTGNPLLAPLGDYGGPMPTMPPLRGSPAIDAGAATSALTDQRGGSRSRDGDGDFVALPDIGAVEAGLIPVTTTADSGPGSLRAALAEATTQPGPDALFFTPIFVIPSMTTDITLASEIFINDPAGVTLDASDLPTGVVIDAGPGTNRHFRIASGTTAVFHRLRLYGGNGTGGETNDIGHGGSIRNEGTLTLRECMIADCTSTTFGGAIFNTNPGTLTIERCTLYGNSASAGGGAIQQTSPNLLTMTACTVANNRGGFEAGGINAPFGPASLIHCTVSGNSVTNPGSNGVGGLRGGALTVRDSIVSGNTDANLPGIPNISPGFTAPGTNLTSGDAKLAPLGAYGGPTFTAPPVPGSPAINAATGSTTDFDQRGFARIGTADLGAAEYRGAPDVRSYWLSDWDGDGQGFGVEHALGTDPLLPDRGNSRNLTVPTFDGLGRAQLAFGVNAAFTPGTQWVIRRSTTLQPGSFTEIFLFDGAAYTFNNAQVGVLDNGTAITVIDRFPPPGKAFYRLEALAP